ncbi:acetyl-CoA transmembrane transporter [Aureococcus anophagefferens]|nr:acetyl-CoA transmembrane transporter [Aureococcus anophagefferens]
MQSLFSLASLPFSLKLLWAPFVDAAYVPAWGRRKTWLVPVQLAIGCLMVASRGRIDAWMADDGSEPNVEALTALFFALYFLCATQDIAVDGWALTMLSERRLGVGALATLKLPPVVGLCAVLLTCKGAFGAADAVTSIRAIEYGMPKEDIALLAPFLLVCSIALPLVIARRTSGARPLDSFLVGVPLRLALNPLIYYLLEYVKYAHGEGGTAADKMAFFARVSDPSFGGTYMTLLNTIANLGGKWPPSLALCASTPQGFRRRRPFLVELAVCTAGGALWFMVFAPRVLALQAIPPSEWRVSAARAPTPPPAV